VRALATVAIALVLGSAGAATSSGGRIVYTVTVGSEQLYHVSASGRVMLRLTAAVTASTDPSVAPDGHAVAFDADPHGNYDVFVRAVRSGTVVDLTPNTASNAYYPAWSPDGARIAFVSDRASRNPQVFVMNADGSGVVQVTHDGLPHERPSWSPNGTRILFDTSGSKTPGDVYAMNDDGSGLVRVASSRRDEWGARWSPDGSWIAYTTEVVIRFPPAVFGYIWLVHPDGSDAHQIPRQPQEDLSYPNWSRDGKTLAFSEDRGDCGIWTMALDGTHRKPAAPVCDLAGFDASGDHLSWGPDGSFWFASAPSSNTDIAIVPAGGGDPTPLTHDNLAFESQPSLSRDGRTVAFTSDRTLSNNIWVMNADGSKPQDVSRSAHDDQEASWSPDAKQIAFATNRGPKKSVEVYVMNRDGSQQRPLTTLTGNNNEPAWSPDVRWIAFANFPPQGRPSLWLVHPDGTGLRRLGVGEAAAWAPDAREIAFLRSGAIWRMDASGGHLRRLTAGQDPSWSPDGTQIAYARSFSETGEHGPLGNGPARVEIRAMNADGSGQHRVAVACDDAESRDVGFPSCTGGTASGLSWGR
jgi:TolB protein